MGGGGFRQNPLISRDCAEKGKEKIRREDGGGRVRLKKWGKVRQKKEGVKQIRGRGEKKENKK